jgi:hypothetical protein
MPVISLLRPQSSPVSNHTRAEYQISRASFKAIAASQGFEVPLCRVRVKLGPPYLASSRNIFVRSTPDSCRGFKVRRHSTYVPQKDISWRKACAELHSIERLQPQAFVLALPRQARLSR